MPISDNSYSGDIIETITTQLLEDSHFTNNTESVYETTDKDGNSEGSENYDDQ